MIYDLCDHWCYYCDYIGMFSNKVFFNWKKKRVLEIDAQFYFWKDGIGILFALRPMARTESYASFFLWLPKIFSTFLTALC